MAGPSIMSGMYYMAASIWPALIGGVSDPRYYPPSSLLCGFNLVLPTSFYTSSSIAAFDTKVLREPLRKKYRIFWELFPYRGEGSPKPQNFCDLTK